MKALIAEDEPTSRMLLQVMLKRYGVVDATTNGAEAVAAVRVAQDAGLPYDIVFLDLNMPVMGGKEALAKMRESGAGPGLPQGSFPKIVMVSAIEDQVATEAEFGPLCDAIVPKPINRERLAEVLGKLGLLT